ncbi:MAG: AIR synthase family protein [Lachnospiraceae bacterium]|nr:AIR synthase family protein [Lachnospiraceae bacterium]
MKIGKLPEPALIRSVLKQVNHRREEVLVGPAVGQDCAALSLEADEAVVLSSDPITGAAKDIGKIGIYVTTNDLAAAGAEPVGVLLTIMLPESVRECKLKTLMQDAESVCKELNIEILGGHTEITKVVNQPVLTVTGVGKIKKQDLITLKTIHCGDDLVVTKWIGLEATTILAADHEEDLKERFPDSLVNTARSFEQYLSVIPESRIAMEHGVSAMHDITEGGIFGALWEMASGANLGVDIDLKKIPIRQETVEVCEYFHVNPYLIMSSGSMLIATKDGAGLVKKLEAAGIHGTVIGRTNNSNDRIIRNGEEVRHLDKPQSDELYKVV